MTCYDAPFVRPAYVHDVDKLNCPEPYCCAGEAGAGGEPTEITGDVSIDNWSEMPLGIEVSTPAAFCLVNDKGEVIGKTFLCKVADEETGAESFEKKALLIGGGDPVAFDPAIHNEVDCDSKACEESEASGLVGWGE